MNNKLFREKSLKRISSPDQLNDYIKVSNPSVWLIISAICILLISLFVWSIRGNVTTSVNSVGVFLDNDQVKGADIVVCCVSDEDAQKIFKGLSKNNSLDVRIFNNYETSNNYVIGKIENMSSKSFKKDIIKKEFSMSDHAADNLMAEPNAYYVPLTIKLEKDPNTSDGYKWIKNDNKDDRLVTEDNLSRIEIITESIPPINFLLGRGA